MPFFMNPFDSEFRANLVLATNEGKQHHITYVVPPNKNHKMATIAWNVEPYDFATTTDDNLTIRYNANPNIKNTYATLDVSLTGLTLASEIVDALNADITFSTFWIAKSLKIKEGNTVSITAKTDKSQLVYWFENVGAEESLRFNKQAGIKEIPSYFFRNLIEAYTDATSSSFGKKDEIFQLIFLDATVSTDLTLIRESLNNSTFAAADVKEDWELLYGRSALFTFKKQTFSAGLPTEIIEYNAGMVVGDLGKRTVILYAGTDPTATFEMPYVLTSADIIVPP